MSWPEQERDLVVKIRDKSDLDAFKIVFERYNAPMINYAKNFVSDIEQAKDITQDTFVSFWENRKKIKSPDALRSFLFKSLKNNCLNYLKHNAIKEKHKETAIFEIKKLELQYSDALNKTFIDYQDTELANQLNKVLKELPDDRRKIFEMSRFDGLKNKEIAEKLNLSVRTVDTQIYRALKQLKDNLKNII